MVAYLAPFLISTSASRMYLQNVKRLVRSVYGINVRTKDEVSFSRRVAPPRMKVVAAPMQKILQKANVLSRVTFISLFSFRLPTDLPVYYVRVYAYTCSQFSDTVVVVVSRPTFHSYGWTAESKSRAITHINTRKCRCLQFRKYEQSAFVVAILNTSRNQGNC